ncbi:putative DNA ligase [Aeromonas phage AhMtk13b]|nr:putative DNA ligase [Aeromonas phage AhMtk13b]
MSEQNKKHRRKLIGWVPGTDKPLAVETDVYRVLDAFKVSDPCLQHLVKKALAAGDRGHKDLAQDYQDIIHSANSAYDLLQAKGQDQEQDAIPLGERRQSPMSKFSFHMVLNDQTVDAQSTIAKFLAGAKRLHGRVGEKSFIISTPTKRLRWPDWMKQAIADMDWVHVAHDEWASESCQMQNMPRAEAMDFSELERRAAATMGKAFSDYLAELTEACASNEEQTERNNAMASYLLSAPYGKVEPNHVRLMQHTCPHCQGVILSCEIPSHKHGHRGYPDATCPHCMDDLTGAEFVNWADVDAIFDNLTKVPPEHLRSFFKAARLHRAGYGTNTSLRAALHNYFVQVLGGEADKAGAFAVKVWPELPGDARPVSGKALQRLRLESVVKALAGHGVTKGTEVVISGGCDFKDLIRDAVQELGGVVRACVTSTTKVIIVGQKPGAKLAKALELGVNIVFACNLRPSFTNTKSEE